MYDLRNAGTQKNRPAVAPIASTFVALWLAGCHSTAKPIPDAQLTSNVQAALAADGTISKQPVTVTTQNGVVSLTGNVSDDTAREVVAQDAAKVKGVREVYNSLTVQGVSLAPTATLPSAPTQTVQTTQAERQALASNQVPPPPAPAAESAPAAPSAPPAPAFRDVTVPAGTLIPIRITESLSSETAQTGEPFNGVVTHEVVHDGLVVLPAGSAVSGRVVAAKDAGHFKGHSLLSVELTAVRRHGQLINVSTAPYTLEGKNRGTNSVEKIGIGAGAGALIGGLLGHGKGAAIGALAGGGTGTAIQASTRGQQVSIASETPLRFRTTTSFTVRTAESPSNYEPTTLHER
jgi:hypothetical protein